MSESEKQGELPSQGGSYIRQEDGTLVREGGTKPAPARGDRDLPQLDHDGDGRAGGSLPRGRRGLKGDTANG